jgi:cell surface protein SprA
MNRVERIQLIAALFFLILGGLSAGGHQLPDWNDPMPSISQDTIPLKDRSGNFTQDKDHNPFDLKDPKVINQKVEYDPVSGEYIVTEKVGDETYRPSSNMSFTEFLNFKSRQQDKEYLKNLAGISTSKRNYESLIDPVKQIDLKKNLADRLFGGFGIDIKPQGSIGFTLGANYSRTDNPLLQEYQRSQLVPNFDMDIRMDVTGNIGDKLKLNTNYDTKAAFDFENKLKLAYDSEKFSEDDIIKKIEAGNVSLPLRSNLIQGSQNLFGFKTEWQFGYLRLTALISQQKSKQTDIQTKGGGVVQEYEKRADEYDENRHFFLSHYNRNNYEPALAHLPEINSQFKLKDIEVWLTEDAQNSRETDFRDIVALTDLGVSEEGLFDMASDSSGKEMVKRFLPGRALSTDKGGAFVPSNTSNKLLDQILVNDQARDLNKVVRILSDPNGLNLKQGRDFEKVRARRLNANEYSYNPELGFISLRSRPRPNQVLAVAYRYLQNGRESDPRSGAEYKVGELSSEVKSDSLNYKVIFVKMLKSSNQSTSLPSYRLMMKNVYPTGGFNLNPEDFTLDIYYQDQDGKQKRFIQEIDGYPLLNLFRLDNLNKTHDPQPDGVFDFIPGQTVIPASGSIIFPVLEPFGSSLKKLLADTNIVKDPALRDLIYKKYNYEQLYDTSITAARRELKSNQFLIKGTYKSGKSNEIPLNTFNLDPNAKVTVSAGSLTLNEGSDYIVDRNLGKVTILNEALLQSGVPISVKFEDNSLFSFQTKTMLGFRAEYSKRKDLSVGLTYMHLFEKPFTEKVNIGEDPINNRVVGLDFNINRKAPWLTRFLDKLPFYSTKENSSWSLQAEAAALLPGHSSAINQNGSEGGVVYIDDFEGSSSGIGLGFNVSQWILSSAPQGISDLAFRGTEIYDNVINNANRALLSWYRIDEFARSGSLNSQNSYCRLVDEREIFPNKQRPIGFSTELTFDMTYYPREKGPYNFDLVNGLSAELPGGGTVTTAGTDRDNHLLDPTNRWAGIMTRLNTNDFEANNVEYIDFWMLNPFLPKPNPNDAKITGDGTIYLQLGNFSEDIFKDGKQQFEHGLPTTSLNLPIDNSAFGKISRVPPLTSSFDINERAQQDLGYDGLVSNDVSNTEAEYFKNYISQQKPLLNPEAANALTQDPSNDNYVSYRSNKFPPNSTVLDKYKRYNMPEGNGQLESGNNQSTAYTGYPDQEDLNNDKSLNEIESYYSYKLKIEKDPATGEIKFDPNDPNNFISDTVIVKVPNATKDETWYRFRIPVNTNAKQKIGEIRDFRSIQAMRLLFTGFDESVTFRFIKFQLGRNAWRKYQDVCKGVDGDKPLILDKVDIEENAGKTPFNYTTPPGIQRERFYSTQYADIQQNESALLVRKENFIAGCENSIYKIIDLDIRKYKRLKMFVHGEPLLPNHKDSVSVFMRLGKDFTDNYYEYEIPLKYSNESFFNQRDSIWPKYNEFDFPLQLLVDLKNKRNSSSIPFDAIYSEADPEKPGNTVKIKGNPTIGLVRGIQLGIRNRADSATNKNMSEDVEVWYNELRLTGLEEKGGFAGLARAEVQLADLGNISLAGNLSTVGWGGIDKKLDERAKDDTKQLDATMNLSLDKFIPEKLGLKVPLSLQYSVATRTPEYDPIDTDIKLQDKIDKASSQAVKDSIRDRAIDYAEIKSFALNNVRKERKGSNKAKPWDIENFSVSYAQSVTTRHNPIIENDKLKTQQGGIDYNFSLTPKYIEPFKKLITSPSLKLIGEFNFNLIPNSFSVRNSLDRRSSTRTYRFAAPQYSTWEDRKFSWNRDYSLTWDLTKSLKFNFSARNEAAIDEITFNPLRQAYIDPRTNLPVSPDQRDKYLSDNLKDFGRTKDYKHNFTFSYAVPTRLIPYLDFITMRAQYTANYNWSSGSLNSIDSLGSVISNGQNISLTNEFNMSTLYNKIKFLKKYTGEGPSSGRFRPAAKTKDDAKTDDKAKKKKEPTEHVNPFVKIALTPLIMLKRIQINYSQNKSTTIPGFMRKPELLGMSSGFTAPGWDFITGAQPDFGENGWLDKAAAKGWISGNCYFNKEMMQRSSNTFGAKVKIEPFKEFNIDLNLDRTYTRDLAETFKNDFLYPTTDMAFQHFTPFENGQYTISYISVQSMFSDIDQVFHKFSDTRKVISKRIGDQLGIKDLSPGDPDYIDGFKGDHIDVVSPAFLAAYTNQDPNTINLDLFKTFPLPNWQLNYSGLGKLGFLKDIFQDFTIRHGYKNTLTINSFKTNLNYKANDNGLPIARRGNDLKASYNAEFEIPELVINETFAPLLGINIKTKSGLELGLDFNKNRNLKLQNSLEGQLIETKATNYTIKAGYTIKDVFLTWLPGMKAINKGVKPPTKKKKGKNSTTPDQATTSAPKGNDLEFTFDFGVNDNVSKIHRLDNNIDAQNFSGSKQISFTPAVKYNMSKSLNIRFFVDYRKTIPYVQNQYKDVRINGGLTIQYTLN